jgi:putative ABC transport system permease protein
MLLFWKIAFRSLFRNGRRNLLTGASIALGLVGVCLLGGYILRMERYLAAQSVYIALNGHVVVYAKDGLDHHLEKPDRYSLSAADQQTIMDFARADARVARTFPVLKATGLVNNGCTSFPFTALAAAPEDVSWARVQKPVQEWVQELAQIRRGQGYWTADLKQQPVNISGKLALILHKNTVAGEPTAKPTTGVLDCNKPEDREAARIDPGVQLVGQGFGGGMALSDGLLVGHSDTGMAFQDDTALMLPLGMAQQMYGTDKATALAIYLKREGDIRPFLRDLNAFLRQKGVAADPYPFYEEAISAFYVGGMQFNWVMLTLFLLLVCSVVGISISNSLYISLMERRSELGTLRSIGFRQEEISRLLLLESLFLLIFSFIPGIALSAGLAAAVNAANWRFEIPGLAGDLQFVLQVTAAFLSIIVAVLAVLVLAVTRVGGMRFLRRPILELVGGGGC